MRRNSKKEIHTFDRFMGEIIQTEPCKKHRAEKGDACFHIQSESGTTRIGICNYRAKKAGFNAAVNNKSLRRGSKS
jgi:hypothetical protein